MPELEEEKKSTSQELVLNKTDLDQIAKNALIDGFIGLDHLIYIMAEDKHYSDILYRLWKGFQCNLRGPEEVDVDFEAGSAGRIRLWFDLLYRWCGMGVRGVRDGLADIKLLPLYKVDAFTGQLRKVIYPGREAGVDYVRLEDLKKYLENIKLLLPERLFSQIGPDEIISPDNIFRPKGSNWEISFEDKRFFLNDSIGLKYIHMLLSHPNQGFSSSTLVNIKVNPSVLAATDGSESTQETIQKMARGRLGRDEEEGLKASLSFDRNYKNIDKENKEIYQLRIQEIEEELESCNVPDRCLELEGEKKFLKKEINQFARPISSRSDDKSRKAVSNAIKRAYKEIGKHGSNLEQYLRRHIKLGGTCTYQPETSRPILWILS